MTQTQIFENTNSGIPPAEIDVDDGLVGSLLSQQYPAAANLPRAQIGSGWDNVVYKLGDKLTLRLPRHSSGNSLLQNEQKWLGFLASYLKLPIPAPIFIGKPTQDFPFDWSINPFFEGKELGETIMAENQFTPFTQFLLDLQKISAHGAPSNPVRGVPLASRDEVMKLRMQSVSKEKPRIIEQIRPIWENAVNAKNDTIDVWLHGDLHNFNILEKQNRISAIIDWGDMCAGDRATDYSAIFTLFESKKIQSQCFQTLEASDETISRTLGWALMMGVLFMDWGKNSQSDRFRIGEKIANRVLAFRSN